MSDEPLYSVVTGRATKDSNGNPRRVALIYTAPQGDFVGVLPFSYSGLTSMMEKYVCSSWAYVELCELDISGKQYQQLVRDTGHRLDLTSGKFQRRTEA